MTGAQGATTDERLREEQGPMSDAAREIENLVYTYAERLDAGDLDGVAALFAHGRICGVEDGPPETVFTGAAGVRQMYEMATRLYDDGTPKTKHLTTNVRSDVDEAAGTATRQRLLLRHPGDCRTCRCRSSSPAITETPSTASTAPGGSTPGSCSSTRSATPATT